MRRAPVIAALILIAGCATPPAPSSTTRMAEAEVRSRVEAARERALRPVDWSSNVHVAASQAVAIVQSYETYAQDCEIGLKVYGKGRLPRDKQESCAQSLSIGLDGSEYRQSAMKLTEIAKDHPEVDSATVMKGIRSANKTSERWLYIRHQLIGR
jgi:hypothetical protein